MADTKRVKPRLVAVDQVPRAVRRSVYVELVDEFSTGAMRNARLEGVKTTASVSIKRAIARLGLHGISVVTANGEVYLTRE
jgi:hypothetical protein